MFCSIWRFYSGYPTSFGDCMKCFTFNIHRLTFFSCLVAIFYDILKVTEIFRLFPLSFLMSFRFCQYTFHDFCYNISNCSFQRINSLGGGGGGGGFISLCTKFIVLSSLCFANFSELMISVVIFFFSLAIELPQIKQGLLLLSLSSWLLRDKLGSTCHTSPSHMILG